MGSWFDEQIKQRKKNDNAGFEAAFAHMAESVTGRRVAYSFEDESAHTKNAVADVLKSFGLKADKVPDNIKDTEEQLEYILRPHGIMHRNVKLTDGWYKDCFGPMIGIRRDDGTAVALIQTGFSGYSFYDSHKNQTQKVDGETQSLFEEHAMCFYRPFPLKSMGIGDLIRYVMSTISKEDNVLLVTASLIVVLVGMLLPKFQNILFTNVIERGDLRVLAAAAIFLISFSISTMLFSVFKSMILYRITVKTQFSVQSAVMMRVLSLPADFFHNYGTGELSQRVGYISSLSSSLLDVVYTTGLSSLMSLLYITQVRDFAPELTLPAIAIILINILLTLVLSLLSLGIARRRMKAEAKNGSFTYALISGVQKIKLAGAEKRAFAKWGEEYAEEARLEYDMPWYLRLTQTIPAAVGIIGTVVLYSIALGTDINAADYYSFNTAYGMVMGAFQSMAGIAVIIAQIRATLEMAEPIMQAEPEVAEDKEVVTRLSGGIELSHVSFRYNESTPYIVDDMSLKIRSGQYVAIVGKTGCGKSTLMRLLLGFEKPDKGAIYYDGKDMSKLDLKSLRRRIGVVMQNGKLILGSIFENVAIACPSLTLDEAWDACEKAGIADDIRQMPMGMSTIITEGGGGISGGQRQRLMIARAIAGKPKLLMLDEATSALDNKTQKQVTEALDALKCTRIVIAHRLSTIRQCDRILLLEDGRIKEDGTYDELIARNGAFAELVERQRL